jgi:hypothetical protein
LQSELRRTAKRGYATNFGESEPEISGVAIAVDGPEPYALAVSEPRPRLAPARVQLLVDEKLEDMLGAPYWWRRPWAGRCRCPCGVRSGVVG